MNSELARRGFPNRRTNPETYPAVEDSVEELCVLIKERYEDFPMHPVCKACRRSRKEKRKCFQTTATGLYRFDCLDKK